jgi:hypothetical protein
MGQGLADAEVRQPEIRKIGPRNQKKAGMVDMGKTCTNCKFEPAWKEIGRDSGDYPQLEGECRAPRAACDVRHKLRMDTEYMSLNWDRQSECQMWQSKGD